MAITKVVRPYELLVRWNPDTGVFSDYHIQTVTFFDDNGVKSPPVISDAISSQNAIAMGFPLSNILQALHIGALTAVDEATAAKDAAIAEKTAAIKAMNAAITIQNQAIEDAQKAEQERDAAIAEAEALKA